MFGWHWDQKNIGRPDCYKKGWRYKREAVTVQDLVPIVTQFTNSPCVWAQGIRLQENFRGGLWLAVDIDDGWPLAQAIQFFQDYVHLIGTTRNHQKQKGKKPPCDRYRVFLKLARFCQDAEPYKATLRKVVDYIGADRACVDTARSFWPCQEIVSMQYGGRLVQLVKPERREYKEDLEKTRKLLEQNHRRVLPWIRDILENGVAENRNNTVFRVSIWLARCGFIEHEIVEMIWSSPIPIAHDRTRRQEIEKTVRSAMRTARGS